MKGIWFVEKGQAAFVDEDRPVCRSNTVLLKTLYSGLSNGTERNKLMGGNYNKGGWPDRIGYQHVSEVIECGAEITKFRVGDVVFTGTYPGHVPYHVATESDLIIRLPEGMDLQAAALMGVASVSMHDARIANVRVEDKVLVMGGGLIGLFAMQAALVMGAEVTLVDRNPDRLDLARSMGADFVCDNTDERAWKLLADMPPFSVCLECSGADVLDNVIGTRGNKGVLERHARLVLVAGRFETAFNFNAASGRRLVTYSTSHFEQVDLEQVLRLGLKGRLHLKALVRDVVPITEAISVYDTLRDEKQKLLGTVFDWTGDHGFG
jgi:2-desacetyl-2-hydroxyethyl bacteriochlorophyllide A dehydrogenase